MKEVLEAIERHLGRSLGIPQLDYYQVIGLDLYCDEHERIRSALQSATNTWMQSETGRYPESAQIVGKLLKQAQLILLDPKKRQLYDSQLAKLRESQAKAMPVPAWNAAGDASSRSLFPAGDPMQPLQTSDAAWSQLDPDATFDFLVSMVDPQNRWAELLQLFPALADPEALTRNRESTSGGFVKQVDAPKLDPGRTAKELVGGGTLVEQIRRRRTRNRSLVAGLLIAGALGLLGIASYAFVSNRAKLANQEKSAPLQRAVVVGESQDAMPLGRPAGKLPRPGEDPAAGGNGSGGRRVVSNLPSVRRDDQSPQPPPAPDPSPEMEPKPEMEPAPPETASPTTAPETASPTTAPETMAPETASPTMEPPNTSPTPAPEGGLPEGMEWKRHMKAARVAIDAGDFKALETEIERALAASETRLGKEMTARLDQLGQLYKIYVDAFEEAKKKARGASSIKVGSSEFSIVESDSQKLIVRAAGKNQTYAWDKLPFGIAAAIADLGLNEQEPVDVAARAVYFSLAPAYRESAKNNELVRKRIDGWFSKSLGKDKVRSDLRQALTDTYE